tara:strand:+ start:7953 stop:9335 length:1383 start_codon:yes stop_codon:yes gene_type:complete
MEEQIEVKEAPKTEETIQNKEAVVLEEAVKSGEVDEAFGLQTDGVYKINLDKPPKEVKKETIAKAEPKVKKEAKTKNEKKDAIPKRETEKIPVEVPPKDSKEMGGSLREQDSKKEEKTVEKTEEVLEKKIEEPKNVEVETNTETSIPDSPLELITEENTKENIKKEEILEKTPIPQKEETKEVTKELPENIDKLIKFLEDTGGTMEDYVNLNRDVSKIDNISLLREYYSKTKPHLDSADIDFLFNKNFAYDGEADNPQDIKAKQLAFKEELFNAQNHFNSNKEKYYADLKLRSQDTITPEHKEAIDHYNNHKQLTKVTEEKRKNFKKQTDSVFNDNFKGFDFNVGKNTYRYKVDNPQKVKEFQYNIVNWVNSHIDNNGDIKDASYYHKSLFAAQNADKLANHFYEQGRADAIIDSARRAKNIKMDPRNDNSSMPKTNTSGIRAVSINDNDTSKLRIKWKQ